MLFFMRFVEKDVRSAHPPQKISRPGLFFNFFINQPSLVNIYVENAANLQSSRKEIISKAHFSAPAAFLIIIILNKNNLFEFKHVDGPDESSMPNSVRMLSSEDSSIEQY